MHSNTKKYSPVKILAILFSLLLTIEISINYFSSSSIHFLRIRKIEDESVDVKTIKEIGDSNKDQYINGNNGNQIDYYDNITKYSSASTSILSYINDNCNYCVNTQFFENYYHKYCPYQPSDLDQIDYCQYFYLRLINEYSFPTLLSSILTLISGKMNSLKLTINNQSKLLIPPNSKCYKIQKQTPRYGASYHTPKFSAPQKKYSFHTYTSPRDKIKIRTNNFNLLYRRIGETQEYLSEYYENITILTSKNLICINTRSKEPFTIDFRNILLNINTNQSKNNNDLHIVKNKNKKITLSNDIPKTPLNKENTNDSLNQNNKLSLILHLLFSGSTTNWVVNLIMTLIKGSLILYLINIVKINENKKNKNSLENGKNKSKNGSKNNRNKKSHQNKITDDYVEVSKKLSKLTKDQKIKKVRSKKGEKKNIHKINSNCPGRDSSKRMSIKSLRDFVNATKSASSDSQSTSTKNHPSSMNNGFKDKNKNHIKITMEKLKSITSSLTIKTKIFIRVMHIIKNFISSIIAIPMSLSNFLKASKITSIDVILSNNRNLKENIDDKKAKDIITSQDNKNKKEHRNDMKNKETQLKSNTSNKSNSIKDQNCSIESTKKQKHKQKLKLNKNQNVKYVEQFNENLNINTLKKDNLNVEEEIQHEYKNEGNIDLSKDKKTLHDSGIFISKFDFTKSAEKIQKSKSEQKLVDKENNMKNNEKISNKNDKKKSISKLTTSISDVRITSSNIKNSKIEENEIIMKESVKSTKTSKKNKKNRKQSFSSNQLERNKIDTPLSSVLTVSSILTTKPSNSPSSLTTTSLQKSIPEAPSLKINANSIRHNLEKNKQYNSLSSEKNEESRNNNVEKNEQIHEINNLDVLRNNNKTEFKENKGPIINDNKNEEIEIECNNREIVLNNVEILNNNSKNKNDNNNLNTEKHNHNILKDINTKGLNKLDNLIKNIITNKNPHYQHYKSDEFSQELPDKEMKDENTTENITLNYCEEEYNNDESEQMDTNQLNNYSKEIMTLSSSNISIDDLNKNLRNILSIDSYNSVKMQYDSEKDKNNNISDSQAIKENKKVKKMPIKNEAILNDENSSVELNNKKSKGLKVLVTKSEKNYKESNSMESFVEGNLDSKNYKKDKNNNRNNLSKSSSNDYFVNLVASTKKKKKKENKKSFENIKIKGHKHSSPIISNTLSYSSSPPNQKNIYCHKKSCSASTYSGSYKNIESLNSKYSNAVDNYKVWSHSPGNIGRSHSYNNSLLNSNSSESSDISLEGIHNKYSTNKISPSVNNNKIMENKNDILSVGLSSFATTPSRSSSYRSNKSNKSWNEEHQSSNVPSRVDSVHNFLIRNNLPSLNDNGVDDLTRYFINSYNSINNSSNNNTTKNKKPSSKNSTPELIDGKHFTNSNYISTDKNPKLAAIEGHNNNQNHLISNYYFMLNNQYPSSNNTLITPPIPMASLNESSLYSTSAINYRNTLNYSNISAISNTTSTSNKNFDFKLLKELSSVKQNQLSSLPLTNSSLNDTESLKDTFNYDLKDIDLEQESILSSSNEEDDVQKEKSLDDNKKERNQFSNTDNDDDDQKDKENSNNKNSDNKIKSKNVAKNAIDSNISLFDSLLDKAQQSASRDKSNILSIPTELKEKNEVNNNDDFNNKGSSYKLKPHPPLKMEQKTQDQEAINTGSDIENTDMLRYSCNYSSSNYSFPTTTAAATATTTTTTTSYNIFSNNVYSPFNTGFNLNYSNNPFTNRTTDTSGSGNANINYISSIQGFCSFPTNSYQQQSQKNVSLDKKIKNHYPIFEDNQAEEKDESLEGKNNKTNVELNEEGKEEESDKEIKDINKDSKDKKVLNGQMNQWNSSYSKNEMNPFYNYNNIGFNSLSIASNTPSTSLSTTSIPTSSSNGKMSSRMTPLIHSQLNSFYSTPSLNYSDIGLPPTQPTSSQSLSSVTKATTTATLNTKTSSIITPIGCSSYSTTTSELDPLSFFSMTSSSSFLTTPSPSLSTFKMTTQVSSNPQSLSSHCSPSNSQCQISTLPSWKNNFSNFNYSSTNSKTSSFLSTSDNLLKPQSYPLSSYSIHDHGFNTNNNIQINTYDKDQMNQQNSIDITTTTLVNPTNIDNNVITDEVKNNDHNESEEEK
ncbi:hypothetical protein BCR36DRAFT_413684 [Piromyces finnis]|uniref:Uncharacterized protein n=1 Tax=Piromyces finnis TaxID=1754191 RepID=A0A1Y1V6N2_9FUNG|nr:hypothetical protein BCR36DRAFT_413684 [Piromyces finnis]|eukprot:ORX47332.1 hypothetical protein BCR36DRAFT_413684 [Piromyces finnis]